MYEWMEGVGGKGETHGEGMGSAMAEEDIGPPWGSAVSQESRGNGAWKGALGGGGESRYGVVKGILMYGPLSGKRSECG